MTCPLALVLFPLALQRFAFHLDQSIALPVEAAVLKTTAFGGQSDSK
jgi:hypothetical protein